MHQSQEQVNSLPSADLLELSQIPVAAMPAEQTAATHSTMSARRIAAAGLATVGLAVGFAGGERNDTVNEAYASTDIELTDSAVAQAAAGCRQKKFEFFESSKSGFDLRREFTNNSVAYIQSAHTGYPGRKNKNKYASINMGFAPGGKRKYSWNHVPGIKTSAVVVNRTGPNSRRSIAIKCFTEQRKLGGYVVESSQQIKQGTRNRSVSVWFSNSR